MVIDMCTRVWNRPEAWGLAQESRASEGLDASSEMHDASSLSTPVSVVVGFRSGLLGADLVNEALAAHVRARADRRLLFAGLDLACGDVEGELDQVQRLGAVGVAISPADQGVRPTDERAIAALESCARRRLVVHVSNPCLDQPASIASYASPLLFDDAARAIPALRLVFGDLGRASTEDTLAMIAKHPSAFAEVSPIVMRPLTMSRVFNEAMERGVIEKLLFGSGFPDATAAQAIEAMYHMQAVSRQDVLSRLTREAVRGIVDRDALGLLDLKAPSDELAPSPTRGRAPLVVAASESPWRTASL
jgi:predicted TIM-barrel fold metal-dependent hydrolase